MSNEENSEKPGNVPMWHDWSIRNRSAADTEAKWDRKVRHSIGRVGPEPVG